MSKVKNGNLCTLLVSSIIFFLFLSFTIRQHRFLFHNYIENGKRFDYTICFTFNITFIYVSFSTSFLFFCQKVNLYLWTKKMRKEKKEYSFSMLTYSKRREKERKWFYWEYDVYVDLTEMKILRQSFDRLLRAI